MMLPRNCAVNEVETGTAAAETRGVGREAGRTNGVFVSDGTCPLGRDRQMPGTKVRLGRVEGVGSRAHREGLAGMKDST